MAAQQNGKKKASARSTSALERQRAEARSMVPEPVEDAVPAPDGRRTFEFDGQDYEIDAVSDWDVRVMLGIEDGHMFVAIRELLGPKQWATFMEKKRTNRDFYAMANALFEGDEVRAE